MLLLSASVMLYPVGMPLQPAGALLLHVYVLQQPESTCGGGCRRHCRLHRAQTLLSRSRGPWMLPLLESEDFKFSAAPLRVLHCPQLPPPPLGSCCRLAASARVLWLLACILPLPACCLLLLVGMLMLPARAMLWPVGMLPLLPASVARLPLNA
jgi:hypothetical protein